MPLTPYTDIDGLLNSLLDRIRGTLGGKLVGIYLYGSLVTGDFDRESSDIDLFVLTSVDIDEQEFERLRETHKAVVAEWPEWDNRVEIAYFSVAALKTLDSHRSRIAVISPGEPFHFKEAGEDWLINRWVLREKGVALFGPPPKELIEPISKEAFLHYVRVQAEEWRPYIYSVSERCGQAYAILTMCRALYAYENAEQASKKEAARWAEARLPQWATLIRQAIVWRDEWRDKDVDHEATFPETVRFVHFVIDEILRGVDERV